MASKEYWKKRAAREAQQMYEDAEAVAGVLRKAYGSASAYLQEQARGIFERFRSKYSLSEAEARRLLMAMQDSTSLQELLQRLQSAEQTEDIINLRMRLEAAAYQARLGRLEKIMGLIDQIIRRLFRKELGITTGWLENLAQQSYFKSIYGISQRLGFLPEFGHVSQEAIKKLLASAWSGESYSSRIWENTQKLARRLKEEFLVNLMTGRTDREMANRIQEEFGKGANNARRLVRTESNHVHTEMRLQGSEEVGIEEYIFLATLDLKTSKICRKMDGKRFKVADRLPGTNCPPMHPWCRSTTLDYFGEEWLKNGVRSALDPVTGQRIKVPLSMTYEEWYEKYVKGHEKEIQEKEGSKNRNLTREQYERYRRRGVGPDTYEEFLKIKEEPEVWAKLQAEYREAGKKKTAPEKKEENQQPTAEIALEPEAPSGSPISKVYVDEKINREKIRGKVDTTDKDEKIFLNGEEITEPRTETMEGLDQAEDKENEIITIAEPEDNSIVDKQEDEIYNESPADDKELLRRYERDVADGWISALCTFENYKKLYHEVHERIIGMTTVAGVTITNQSEHFLTRVIGTALNPAKVKDGVYSITGVSPQGFRSNARNGVEIDDIIETLQNGTVEKVKVDMNGQKSIKICSEKCKVSINPDTGNLIQCNP